MKKNLPLIYALIPIAFLVFLLVLNVIIYGADSIDGPNQIALLMGAAVSAVIGKILKVEWSYMRTGIVKSIGSAMPSIIILLLIGALAGTWLLSGVVPAMIYYGLMILNAKIFLFAATIICCLVSLATGSSWSTIATIGVALLGIGSALGVPKEIIAGAIISGAYFGDKMSPLSDTTNLAPAMAGTDIFTHIRYMLYTTIPTLTITLLLFLFIGLFRYNNSGDVNVSDVMIEIKNTFNITPWLFLVPAILIFIILKKMPPIPALLIGALLGGVFAIIFQPHIINQISGIEINKLKSSYIAIMKAMSGEITIPVDNENIQDLLTTRGMAGMLNTIWLILSAMIFGGVMEATGFLTVISSFVMKRVKKTGSLVASTVGTCIFFNITASDQYISIVVPGRMYAKTYRDMGYKPELLSRTLEDSGTVTSVLIPWNTGGATQATVLGVPTLSYLPYCFFNIISPFMSILFAYLNIKIRRITNGNKKSGNEPDFSDTNS
ncbi:MAG: Na+/H+ antiporter NhaC family protein [Marinilabiliales bacterium]